MNAAARTSADRVLVLREDASAIEPVARLLEEAGFSVHSHIGTYSDADPGDYGAIVRRASRSDLKRSRLALSKTYRWNLQRSAVSSSAFAKH